MNCQHNHRPHELTKFGGPKVNMQCRACEEHEALKKKVVELEEKLKQTEAAFDKKFKALVLKFDMSRPLILD